jgi:PadR family transcriptional regulator PadR
VSAAPTLENSGPFGYIMCMSGVARITGPLLDVLEQLLNAHNQRVELHGWSIVHHTKRTGPTVYRVLDRLEDAGWVTARWDDPGPDPGRPRRRLYRFSPSGLAEARVLLAARRPGARTAAPPRTAREAFGMWLRVRLGGAA